MKRIRSIVIVGGGSSGWMAAAYLSNLLSDIEITLIESKKIPVIGVGEATLPSLVRFMHRLGFTNHRAWLQQCDATIKTGISFRNWYQKGDSYWHPFEALEYVDGNHHTGHCWLQLNRNGDPEFSTRKSFYSSFHVTQTLNHEQDRGPVVKSFAFHLDADRFGQVLRQTAKSVKHVLDDVVDVKLDESGDIQEILTLDHGSITGDLFVDCTGFKRRIIRHLDTSEQLESYSSSLHCDRAVVLRFPYVEETRHREMKPYVRASAESAGWIWTIPLYSRISSGYVYSSSFISDGDAEQELREYWGQERTSGITAHKIKFETGKLKYVWIRNCVAIGLAAGFIEPLESTGLAITQLGVELLASILDARYYDDRMIQRYNVHLDKLCNDICEFIAAHYCFTRRVDTPFWQAAKNDTLIPDSLSARLEIFRRFLPTINTKGLEEPWFFRDFSWFAVLLGMNFPFETPRLGDELLAKARALKERNLRFIAQSKCPVHYDCLKREVFEMNSAAVRSKSQWDLSVSGSSPDERLASSAASTSS